jgi:hypothetical protein
MARPMWELTKMNKTKKRTHKPKAKVENKVNISYKKWTRKMAM